MKRTLAASAIAFVLVFAVAPAFAQDALVLSLKRCNDRDVPADVRIRGCTAITGAEGVDPFDVAVAWLDLGIAYMEQGGDRQRELDAYTKALALAPNLWQARVNRAGLYLESGNLDLALADYRAMRATDPDKLPLESAKSDIGYRTAPIDSGTVRRSDMDIPGRERSDYEAALKAIGRALHTGFGMRCRARAMAGLELDAALGDCNAALEIDPTDATAQQGRGIVEFRRADWPGALADFGTVLKAHSDAAGSLFLKGVVERRMGNSAAGDRDIAAAEAIDSRVAGAYRDFGIQP